MSNVRSEAAARRAWCPDARLVVRDADGGNRVNPRAQFPPDYETLCRCLASDCMAWRWKVIDPARETYSDKLGYCGRAGAP